ncbi:mRNA cap guanine-N7 methyltransferase [Coemansia sp. RSA 989]|nr:mRNA cap guanine-N7 methyltransferase [Coemansia sp. RSA 1086]KAJ1865671.1 mRNA cap guanine-N7 methyltransferase [Coemansia sp. RSA 989]KAJ2633061.1 mRNA cap guanine-N7 methyltransferase [Coemansia sp. RSA 1290]KAJ2649594.1 mRNA cap guanine-N7 methyltransferase [Coemansia sp. RSA 1250]KAJ2669671.1 mRNA cap guanine-N7 methyltransferase [Coemansia sp. RSA 1085]
MKRIEEQQEAREREHSGEELRYKTRASQVAEHYNQRRELGVEGRMHTKITGLRLFNNWIKSLLIRQYAFAGSRVLDLGCGKGGDLRKWSIAGIAEYVGMDIAQVSVQQAQRRFADMQNPRFKACFFAQDCYAVEKRARSAGTRSFGNSVYQVEFASPLQDIGRFGTAYSFTLDEAVEDCTEYLVHLPTFIQLAKEHQLELELCCSFHQLFAEHKQQRASMDLFHRMRVLDAQRPEISLDEWEAVGIYLAVAFRKK